METTDVDTTSTRGNANVLPPRGAAAGGALPRKGFSLIELLVAMAVLGIMLTMAMPTLSNMVTSTRLSAEITSLYRGLNFARSEAIKRGQSVTLCPPATTPPGATTGCATAQDWSASGWIVSLNAVNGATAQTLMIGPAPGHGDTMTNSLTTNPTFLPSGYTFFSGTISVHDANASQGLYQCIVFSAGNWSIQKGAACP